MTPKRTKSIFSQLPFGKGGRRGDFWKARATGQNLSFWAADTPRCIIPGEKIIGFPGLFPLVRR
jgi:hypothetical protein